MHGKFIRDSEQTIDFLTVLKKHEHIACVTVKKKIHGYFMQV